MADSWTWVHFFDLLQTASQQQMWLSVALCMCVVASWSPTVAHGKQVMVWMPLERLHENVEVRTAVDVLALRAV